MYDIEFYGGEFLLRKKDFRDVRHLEIIKCLEEQYL
jgi:hypothetical protein